MATVDVVRVEPAGGCFDCFFGVLLIGIGIDAIFGIWDDGGEFDVHAFFFEMRVALGL